MPKLRIISYFISLILCHNVSAKVHCLNQWGPAKLTPGKCLITKEKTTEPSSLLIKGMEWDPKKETFAIRMKFHNPQSLEGLKFSFLNRGSVAASYTLPLYTDPEYNIFQEGLNTWLSIPASSLIKEGEGFEGPFNGLTLYLSHKNVEEPLILEIVDFKTFKKPNKGLVSITFDDGYSSNFSGAKVMKKFDLPGTAYLIPKTIDQSGYLSQKELKTMKAWNWSLSTHLTTPVTQIENLKEALKEAKTKVSGFSKDDEATHFALPLGKYNEKARKTLKEEFATIRLAGGGFEALPILDPTRLKTINVTQNMKAKDIVTMCEKAIANGDWAILMFHYLDRPEKGDLNYPLSAFETLMKGLSKHQANILPVDRVFKRFAPIND